MLRALPIAAIGLDREGVIFAVNRSAETLLGWREIELQGRSALDAVFLPEHRDRAQREITRVVEGEPRTGVATLRRADGRRIELDVRASAVHDDSGWTHGLIATLTPLEPNRDAPPDGAMDGGLDPSEIARALAGSPFLDRLAELIVDRLGDSERVRGDFLATMSHELRTPLHVILGYAGLLLEGAFGVLPTPYRDPLSRIQRRAHELHDLITNTLSLTRLETEGGSLHVEPVALGGLLAELINDQERMSEEDEARISLEIASDLPVIETDVAKLTIVLRNLIGNALKFTDEGWVRVAADHNGSQVTIEVQDSGVGMSADEIHQLFGAYAQTDSGRARGGVGLGLYIVQQLSTRLGGFVEVESTPGKGSTFRLHLPLNVQPADGA